MAPQAKRRIHLLLAAAFAALWGAAAAPAGAQVLAGSDEPTQALRNEVVARVDGEELTRQDLAWFVGNGKLGLNRRDVFTRQAEALRPLVEEYALSLQGAPLALEADGGVDPEELQRIQDGAGTLLISILYDREIRAKTPEAVSEEEARQYYEDNSAAWKRPFNFAMRHIFKSNYQKVRVEEGDTLVSLAEEIAKDPEAVGRILVDGAEKVARAPEYDPKDPSTVPEIEEGEWLLVPVSEERSRMNREALELAVERVRRGEAFEEVAEEVSDNETKGDVVSNVGLSGRPVLEPIMQAARETEAGEVSPVFETKHGWNVMLVESKDEGVDVSFEDARPDVEQRIVRNRLREKADAFIAGLLDMPEFEVDYDALADPDTADDAVVATLGETSYTKKDLSFDVFEPGAEAPSREELREMLVANRPLQRDLLIFRARKEGLDETREHRMRRVGEIDNRLKNLYLNARRDAIMSATLSEEEKRDFFEEHQELMKMPAAATFYAIGVELPETAEDEAPSTDAVAKAVRRVHEWTKGVRTAEAFQEVIEAHKDELAGGGEKTLYEEVPVERLPDPLPGLIEGLEPGSMSQPVLVGEQVFSIFLLEETPPRVPTFEEVEPQLDDFYRRIEMEKFPGALYQEWLEDVDVVMTPAD